MAYCQLCKRAVGVEKKRPILSTIIFIILGLIVPLWFITLPFFWGLAVLNWLIRSRSVCGVCRSRDLLAAEPAAS